MTQKFETLKINEEFSSSITQKFETLKINEEFPSSSSKIIRTVDYLINKLVKKEDFPNKHSNTDVEVTSSEIYNLLNVLTSDRIIFNIERIVNEAATEVATANNLNVNDDLITILKEEYTEELFNELDRIEEDFSKSVLNKLINYHIKVFNGDVVVQVNAISNIAFTRTRTITITFNPNFIKAYFKNKSSNYFSVNADHLTELKNVYTIKLFEYLLQTSSILADSKKDNTLNFSITPSELKTILAITNGQYERYGDFKKRLLVPSINSINDLGYNIDFVEIKEGKKVTAIEFKIQD